MGCSECVSARLTPQDFPATCGSALALLDTTLRSVGIPSNLTCAPSLHPSELRTPVPPCPSQVACHGLSQHGPPPTPPTPHPRPAGASLHAASRRR